MTRYPYTIASFDTDQVQAVVAALNLVGFVGTCASGTTVEVLFSSPLSANDKTTLDNALAGYTLDSSYQVKKVRTQASSLLSSAADVEHKLLRAVCLCLLDQLNTIRAALPTPLAALTWQQVENAVSAKLNSGAAD